MVAQLHAELLPLADEFHLASDRGLFNLKKLPYRGAQWEFRAFQRDPFVMAFIQSLPAKFGTFIRRDDLLSQRRLVFHSAALNTDLVLRRRGSFGAFRSASPAQNNTGPMGVQDELPFELPASAVRKADPRLAALIWDTPTLNKKHEATSTMPLAVRLARRGFALDDNEWESGFLFKANDTEDLIADRIEYQNDMPDWDVDTETDAK